MENKGEKQPLLNTYVNNYSMVEVLEKINQLILTNKKSYIIPINVDVVVKIEEDMYLKKIVDGADIVLVDGKPLIWISKIFKNPIKEKVSGSDLVSMVCKMSAENSYSIFIVGGKDGIADKAKKNLLRDFKRIKICGTYSPPFGFEEKEQEIIKMNQVISDAKPDILIVCFGCPKQEKWVFENYNKYESIVSICAGATVDFLAENVKRSPKWMSEIGLEWFYRFMQEPRRLFKRYFVDDLKIIKIIKKYRGN